MPSDAPVAGRANSTFRILIVASDTFPPSRVDVSILFGEELAGRGHSIDWILRSAEPCQKPYVVNWGAGRAWVGPTDLGTSLLHRMVKHLRSIIHDLKIFSRASSGEYDVIQVKDKFIAGLFAVLACRLFHVRFVYWLSWPIPEDSLTRARDGNARYPRLYLIRGMVFRVLLYRVLMPAADHVFVQSEQMKRDIATEGIPLVKMTAVPMGVKLSDFNRYRHGRARRFMPTDVRSLLYLGTLAKSRRLDFLVRVLVRVRKEAPDVFLYFVGRGEDPTDEQFLMTEAQRQGVFSSVIFTGQLPRAEAIQYVKEADVCLSPFYPTPILNSASPTKLVEYMAMGRPVVANDHPEQRLLIEKSGAGLCAPWDEEAFAAAILRLLENPELARKMGERGVDYIAKNRGYGTIADLVERDILKVASMRLAASR